jgi:hypothetical protein
LDRREVRLGLRSSVLRRYGEEELLSIEDIAPFVIEQRRHLVNGIAELQMPEERVYIPADDEAIMSIGIDTASTQTSSPQ